MYVTMKISMEPDTIIVFMAWWGIVCPTTLGMDDDDDEEMKMVSKGYSFRDL